MINIDVICLTNTNDTEFYELIKQTLDTLLLTKGEYIFDIKLMESNIDSNFIYDYPNLQVITPNEKFNYNKFLNIGLKYCTNDWVLIINNDLVFTPEWLDNIMVEYHSDPNIKSFSPFEPDWFNKYYYGLFNEGNVYTGYTTGVELLGWCILVKKEVLDLINGFDEQFVFYYQDNDYGLTLQKHGINHALIKNSVVYHLMSKSHNLMSEEEYKYNTQKYGCSI